MSATSTKKSPLEKEAGQKVEVHVSPRWTFDRLFAIFILLVALCTRRGLLVALQQIKELLTFPRVRYDRIREDRATEIEANGGVIVGVGTRYYGACGNTSDSRIMAERVGLPPEHPCWKVIEIIDEDNASNYLKRNSNSPSLPDLIRNVQKRQHGVDRWTVFAQAMLVFLAWFESLNPQREGSVADEPKLRKTVNRSMGGKQSGIYSPFSIRDFLDLMWKAGWELEVIEQHARFWCEAFDTIRQARNKLDEVFLDAARAKDVLYYGSVVVVETDNEDLGNSLLTQQQGFEVVVIRRKTANDPDEGERRNTVILSRTGIDLSGLATFLQAEEGDSLEGGLWLYENTRGAGEMLINGSALRPLPPTGKDGKTLVKAIQEHVVLTTPMVELLIEQLLDATKKR